MLEEILPSSFLLPSMLLSCALLLVLFIVFDYGEDKAREERKARREKILRNTKEEAIKQVGPPYRVKTHHKEHEEPKVISCLEHITDIWTLFWLEKQGVLWLHMIGVSQAREPIVAVRRPGDVESEWLGRVAGHLEGCVVRSRQ